MRISTGTMYSSSIYGMQQQQSAIAQTQQQLSTGVKTPADDPVAAAQALMVSQANSINTQYQASQTAATNRLSLNESVLQSVTSLIQNVQSTVVSSGNGALSNSDRSSMASQLSGMYQQLISLANSTDGTGVYLFSGGMGSTQPFQDTGNGVQYIGDQSAQQVQIAPSQQVQVSLSGADVFQNIKSGNGFFTAQPSPSNVGGATINTGTITNQANWNASSQNFTVKFTVAGGVTTYDVIDNSTGTPVATAQPYSSGGTIPLGTAGASVAITGVPANGDSFTVQPSANESIFTTLNNVIKALQTPVNNAQDSANLNNALSTATQNLSNDLGNILKVRAANGARINQVTAAQATSNSMGVQYQTNLTKLQGVDFTQAISQLNQETLALQAAQKSFLQVSNLSLFTYMP